MHVIIIISFGGRKDLIFVYAIDMTESSNILSFSVTTNHWYKVYIEWFLWNTIVAHRYMGYWIRAKRGVPRKKGNHKKYWRGNIILFVGPGQEERREHRAQEGVSYKIMVIKVDIWQRKEKLEPIERTFINQIKQMGGKMGGKPRETLSFDYMLVWCAFTTWVNSTKKLKK